MSNAALAIFVVVVLVGLLLLGINGMRRIVLVGAVLIIALLAYLVWSGRLKLSDLIPSIPGHSADNRGGFAPPTPPPVRNRLAVLDSLRVRGALPAECKDAAAQLVNAAAPPEVRVFAARRLLDAGAQLEVNHRPIGATEFEELVKP